MGVTCECGKEIEGVIKKSRFDEVYNERKSAKQRIAELESDLKAAKDAGEGVDQLRLTNEQLKEQLQASNKRYETHQTISGYGITDPDTVKAIEFFASQNGGDLAETMAAWKDKPESAPTVLRGLFSQADGPTPPPATPDAPQPPQAPPSQPPGWPNVNQGAQQPPPPTGRLTASEIANMSREDFQAKAKDPNSEIAKLLNMPMGVR